MIYWGYTILIDWSMLIMALHNESWLSEDNDGKSLTGNFFYFTYFDYLWPGLQLTIILIID